MSFKYLDNNGLQYFWNKIVAKINEKQDTLVSGTNIKTINNTSLLGSGNITISSGGTATDVQVNGTSIVSSNTANLRTNGTYNASTNKIATMSDVPTTTSQLTNNSNFVVDSSYVHTDNNFTTTLKNKLDAINGYVEGSYRLATMQHPIVVKEWNTSDTYYLDNFVIYNNHIYRCIADEATAGSFVTNEWQEKDLLNWCFENTYYLKELQSNLGEILSFCELTENKVTSISSSSTNDQYPSARAVYNYINSLNGNGVSY